MSTDLGSRLRSLRKARGLSQEAVARRADIGLRAYGDLERGRASDPHYSTLEGIAHALGTTVAELVGEESEASNVGKVSAPPPSEAAGLDFEIRPFNLEAAYWIENLNAQAEPVEHIIEGGSYDLETIWHLEGAALEFWGTYSRTVRRLVREWCTKAQTESLRLAETRMREARSAARRAYLERREAEQDRQIVDELEAKRRAREARYEGSAAAGA
jgi:transcriptional regulator with XRE-family HTH domain